MCVWQARLAFLSGVYQRLLAARALSQPQTLLGDLTWDDLCDVINEQIDLVTSDLQSATDKVSCVCPDPGVGHSKSSC